MEFVRFIFSLEEVKSKKLAFLSNNICQDPLECFFGRQRQRGGTNDNPTAADFLNNSQALRVVDSFCRPVVRGNCRGAVGTGMKRKVTQEDSTPLTRRKRARH